MPHHIRAALAALAVTFTACGASEGVRNDDPPPSTVSNRCGETGACEDSAPADELAVWFTTACTSFGQATAPGDWALVAGCTELLLAAPVDAQQAFADRWLR